MSIGLTHRTGPLAGAPGDQPRAVRQDGAPAWLLGREPGLRPCGCVGKRAKGTFVAKTLAGASAIMRQAVFTDELASRRGLLQLLDPRVKLVTTIALLVVIGLAHSLPVVAVAYLGTLALAAASRVPVWFFVKRVWLFIPIFTGLVVLPATLSVVTPGRVVLPLWHWHGALHGVTAQGLYGGGMIVTRVATSVSLVVLMTLTTPWARLLTGLRGLGVPKVFVLIIGMAYRYLFLLLDVVDDAYTARRARSVKPETGTKAGRGFVAAGAGTLFGKAHRLSEEVHQAMTSRGYTGDAALLDTARPGLLDGVWSLAVVAISLCIIVIDRGLLR